MGNEEKLEKVEPIKMEYPKSLLYAVRGALEEDNPTVVTSDVLSGIQYAVSTLSEREQFIILGRYREHRTLRSIGEDLGVIGERVRQVEVKALRKLRSRRNMGFMVKGVAGYIKELCEKEYERGHQVGYSEGYQQGIEDAPQGITKAGVSVTISSLPVEALELSTRTYNALKRAGYETIGEIIPLTHREMIHVKNLGPQQRQEVAVGLHKYGITQTEWDLFYPIMRKNENGGK